MIRFQPDTWRDALLRPLAMASPDGGVYLELIAPDFRFIFIILAALAWMLLARRAPRRPSSAPVLLALTALAFVPWLATTGNGRYFMPFLLIAGPLCIGLLHLLPATRSFRVTLAVAIVAWQGFLIYEIDPWRYWGHVTWSDGPPFDVDVPQEVADQPATYVTLSSISYSLIAPRFHPASRWVNITTRGGLTDKSPDGQRVQALLAAPGALKAIFPTVPGGQETRQIDPSLANAIDDLLAGHGLSIANPDQCHLMLSSGLAGMASSRLSDSQLGRTGLHGFWLCSLARHASQRATQVPPVPQQSQQVFEKLERLCPRIFPPGEAGSLRIPSGAVRGYPSSDFKIYVMDDGRVWYKYIRALNGGNPGDAETILKPGFTMDCDHIRGRSGLPWEREI